MIASLQERAANEEVERADGHTKGGLTLAHPFPLASREMRDARTVVNVAGVRIGGAEVVVIAGPCSVESREQLLETARPVMLKRGPSATIKEWLLAAEYLLAGGNSDVVLCERGIKTFETDTRNTLDLAAVALARELSHLPVVVDPSHATGRRDIVPAAARAAIAVGVDGLLVEVHPRPERALSDGPQSLDLEGFNALMESFSAPPRRIARAASWDDTPHATH